MARINVVTTETATAEQKALFDAIHSQLGIVPNFLKVFANSPDALKAFLGLHGIANGGSLDLQTRERIALTLAQQNSCEYCLSAHTAIGGMHGVSAANLASARHGHSDDPKTQAAITLALEIVRTGPAPAGSVVEARCQIEP